MPDAATAPTEVQAPITHLLPTVLPRRREHWAKRVLWAALCAGAWLLVVGLAAWAFMSLRVAWLLLHMH